MRRRLQVLIFAAAATSHSGQEKERLRPADLPGRLACAEQAGASDESATFLTAPSDGSFSGRPSGKLVSRLWQGHVAEKATALALWLGTTSTRKRPFVLVCATDRASSLSTLLILIFFLSISGFSENCLVFFVLDCERCMALSASGIRFPRRCEPRCTYVIWPREPLRHACVDSGVLLDSWRPAFWSAVGRSPIAVGLLGDQPGFLIRCRVFWPGQTLAENARMFSDLSRSSLRGRSFGKQCLTRGSSCGLF